MREVETELRSLLDVAKIQGHVTFLQVSQTLENGPPDAEALDRILMALEAAGIDVIDAED